MQPPSSDDAWSPPTYHPPWPWVSGALGVLLVAWVVLRWKPSRVRIEGGSMVPTLVRDDWCLVVRPGRWHRGDVVLVEHPARPGHEMVKRLIGLPGDVVEGRVLAADQHWVQGDRLEASTDSRRFGPVPGLALRGRVLAIYGPKARRRVFRRA